MRRILESTALLLLIFVVCVRPLISESYDSSSNSISEALRDVSDPSPVRTLVFDLIILVAGVVWLASRAIDPSKPVRRTGMGIAILIWLVAVFLSCFAAGNKRLAINASFDWLCLLLVPMLLAQLMNKPYHRYVLLAAIIASAAAQTFACFDQYFVSYQDTWEHYQDVKTEFWAQQNVPLDSEKVTLFENRIRAREALGYMPHSNATGSYLMLCLIPLVGMAASSLIRRSRSKQAPPTSAFQAGGKERNLWPAATGIVLAIGIGIATLLTKSRGALLSGFVGLFLFVAYRYAKSRPTREQQRRTVIAVVLFCVVAVVALAYVTHVGTPYTTTLLFRWQYWRSTVPMIFDHFLFGVGRENFGRHYLHYKAIDSPEEVSTPHNFLLQIAADFGVIGVVATMVMVYSIIRLLRYSDKCTSHEKRVGAKALSPTSKSDTRELSADSTSTSAPLVHFGLWGAVLLALVVATRLILSDSSNPSFVYYTTMTTALSWAIGFVVAAFVCARGFSATYAETRGRLLSGSIILSLIVFMIHELINFALFVPGTAITFFALLGAAPKESERKEFHTRARWRLYLATAAAVFAFAVGFHAMPIIRCDWNLQQAQVVATQNQPIGVRMQTIAHHLTVAANDDSLDPTPLERLAELKLAESTITDLPGESLDAAITAVSKARTRDPYHLRLARLQIQIQRRLAEISQEPLHYSQLCSMGAAALTLYPNDPNGYITLADAQAAAFKNGAEVDVARRAIKNYERALELDTRRWFGETIRRFTDRQKAELQAKIKAIQELINERAAKPND